MTLLQKCLFFKIYPSQLILRNWLLLKMTPSKINPFKILTSSKNWTYCRLVSPCTAVLQLNLSRSYVFETELIFSLFITKSDRARRQGRVHTWIKEAKETWARTVFVYWTGFNAQVKYSFGTEKISVLGDFRYSFSRPGAYHWCTIIDRKNAPPACNHLDIGALRLPT